MGLNTTSSRLKDIIATVSGVKTEIRLVPPTLQKFETPLIYIGPPTETVQYPTASERRRIQNWTIRLLYDRIGMGETYVKQEGAYTIIDAVYTAFLGKNRLELNDSGLTGVDSSYIQGSSTLAPRPFPDGQNTAYWWTWTLNIQVVYSEVC